VCCNPVDPPYPFRERTIITRPDIILRRKDAEEYPVIIDAKYKREEDNSDYYQVIAHALAIPTAEVCCLIYPAEDEGVETGILTLDREAFDKTRKDVRLHAIKINLFWDQGAGFKDYITKVKRGLKDELGLLTSTVSLLFNKQIKNTSSGGLSIMLRQKRSRELFKKAKRLMPGGVNSPVRAFKAVGGTPLFISYAKGSKIYDVDGNEYIDYVLSWGPLILGHAHPRVVNALKKAVERGTSYGAPTPLEIELAQMIRKAYPSMEMVRMVNSGTEATMSAIRVARGYTGRNKVIKFEGCYHGHADGLLVKAGSGAMTFGVPDSPGVPEDYARNTITLPFNDLRLLERIIKKEAENIACIILEPVVGNIGCVLPRDGFLEGVRELTRRHGIVLIFDEVMTGFRVSYGGAQKAYGIKPDMTCLGKVIGGGLPVGAYGGKKEIMRMVAPDGPVYQAGTLSGNPLAMTAGIETLKILSRPDTYERLFKKAEALEEGLKDAAKRAGVRARFYRAGTMFCTYFTDVEVVDYQTAATSDTERYSRFFRGMLERGINLAPSKFEAGFISTAHSMADINRTIRSAYEVMKRI